MTEQRYRVTVPAEFSADDVFAALDPFPRVRVERIERPVSNTDEPEFGWDACPSTAAHAAHEWNVNEGEVGFGSRCAGIAAPSLPTREQIAEAIYTVRAGSKQNWRKAAFRDDYLKEADAVLTLLHKGADR